MLKIKRISLLLAVIMLTAMTAGCANAEKVKLKETVEENKPGQVLKIGLMPAEDAVACTIAKERGYFEKYGVNVDLEIFKSAKDRDAAFQAGKLDGVSTDEVAVALYQNAGTDLKITGVVDGDFILIASKESGIKSINDVKGKSVAISENTVIEYTMDRMLEKNSIDPKDVKKTVIPAIPTRLEMLRGNKIDLALLPEPFASFALNDGCISLGKATDNALYPAVMGFTNKSISEKTEEIKAFHKAYNDAVEYINKTSISEYEDLVIKTVGYPEEMKGKIVLPEYRNTQLPTDGELQDVLEWAKAKGIIKDSITTKDLVNSIAVK